MSVLPETRLPQSVEANIKSILDWLALSHSREAAADPAELHRQLLLLRETPVATAQHVKLLDLLYRQAERTIETERPSLREVSLPVSRRLRQRVRQMLKLLETLTQDYFNTLSELFDPLGRTVARPPEITLRRVMHCVAWQIRINYLVASPSSIGLWQQLHAAYGTARRLGVADAMGPHGEPSVHHIYTSILLTAIAQPASFSADELELISEYIENSGLSFALTETAPAGSSSIFWIDLDKDFPAHALARRIPAADVRVLYFSCDAIASKVNDDLTRLDQGASIGLPARSDLRAGQGVLRRLLALWGHPAKRKFPRRRQSYRTRLCAGFNNIWHLLKTPGADVESSEWMVINESPDGYALMHVAGQTHRLRVGDIAALRPTTDDHGSGAPAWQICIVRWALSENPEHIELGLQMLAREAVAAQIAQPDAPEAKKTRALILPEAAPLRPAQSLIVATGSIADDKHKIIVLVEKENLEIREVRATHLDEQTSRVEVFSVLPDETA